MNWVRAAVVLIALVAGLTWVTTDGERSAPAAGEIAVLRVTRAGSEIVLVRDGRPARVLLRERNRGRPDPAADSTLAWSPDGRSLAFVGRDSGDDWNGIFVLDAVSGETRRVVRGGLAPVWSRDGAWMAYSDGERISILRPEEPDLRRVLVDDPAAVAPDAFTAEGRLAYRRRGADYRHELRTVSLDGTGDRPLVAEADGLPPDVSRSDSGRLLVVPRHEDRAVVEIRDLGGNCSTRLGGRAAYTAAAWRPGSADSEHYLCGRT